MVRYALPAPSPDAFGPKPEAVQVEVHDRCRVEGKHLADNEPADDGDAERAAKF